MIELLFSAIPFIVGTTGLILTCTSYFQIRPTFQPEIVLVRAPYGFPKSRITNEMRLQKEEQHFNQGPLHHLQFPIQSQKDIERAMIEIGNRLSIWRRYFSTTWFLLHAPTVNSVSFLETMLTTHGYSVSVMDVPIPTKDGFPTSMYYEWAEECPFVKDNEDLIQSYHSSWQSWPNTGRQTFQPTDKEDVLESDPATTDDDAAGDADADNNSDTHTDDNKDKNE